MTPERDVDKAAEEYVREGDCELFDTYSAHEATFKAGADWQAKRADVSNITRKVVLLTQERDELRREVERQKDKTTGALIAGLSNSGIKLEQVAWERTRYRDQCEALAGALEPLVEWAIQNHEMPGYSEVILNADQVEQAYAKFKEEMGK